MPDDLGETGRKIAGKIASDADEAGRAIGKTVAGWRETAVIGGILAYDWLEQRAGAALAESRKMAGKVGAAAAKRAGYAPGLHALRNWIDEADAAFQANEARIEVTNDLVGEFQQTRDFRRILATARTMTKLVTRLDEMVTESKKLVASGQHAQFERVEMALKKAEVILQVLTGSDGDVAVNGKHTEVTGADGVKRPPTVRPAQSPPAYVRASLGLHHEPEHSIRSKLAQVITELHEVVQNHPGSNGHEHGPIDHKFHDELKQIRTRFPEAAQLLMRAVNDAIPPQDKAVANVNALIRIGNADFRPVQASDVIKAPRGGEKVPWVADGGLRKPLVNDGKPALNAHGQPVRTWKNAGEIAQGIGKGKLGYLVDAVRAKLPMDSVVMRHPLDFLNFQINDKIYGFVKDPIVFDLRGPSPQALLVRDRQVPKDGRWWDAEIPINYDELFGPEQETVHDTRGADHRAERKRNDPAREHTHFHGSADDEPRRQLVEPPKKNVKTGKGKTQAAPVQDKAAGVDPTGGN